MSGFVSQSGWYTSLIKSTSNNLAISLYYIFFVLGEMVETLLGGLGLWVMV
jgi:hypothetical protein